MRVLSSSRFRKTPANSCSDLAMHISSSVSASPMHWNLNSFRDSANFLLAEDRFFSACMSAFPSLISSLMNLLVFSSSSS
uniref:Uncharacterized protein n=1 Tax=Anguilla anguilla TaxID=7936 RepID=A0A0E9QEA9_ANGAN